MPLDLQLPRRTPLYCLTPSVATLRSAVAEEILDALMRLAIPEMKKFMADANLRGIMGILDKAAEKETRLLIKVIQDGQAAPGTRVINHHKDRISYVIDDARHQYRVVPWHETSPFTNKTERPSGPLVTALGQLREYKDFFDADNRRHQVSGRARPRRHRKDRRKRLGLVGLRDPVRSEMDVLNPQTGTIMGLVVEELSDIQVGVTPDPSAFRIPPGYREVRK